MICGLMLMNVGRFVFHFANARGGNNFEMQSRRKFQGSLQTATCD